ncbi:hypothetical protein BOTCAL_0652g00020 [Botryotinia calthae]|uniref:DUF7730 domain-containing protein n=1 Tax=Botryotinia calthae TaxID=38488 RepID=A0A4Y8CKF0_9HELO|nr:hypothetical protein BOTCAL_0652g00020 [Botryotinia calthae]
MPSRRHNKPPKCPLLALPRETRDEIHRYVQVGQRVDKPRVMHSSYIEADDNTIWPKVHHLLRQTELRESEDPEAVLRPDVEDILILARTCEQLYKESNQVFYSENTFSFAGTWSLYCYLYMIGEEKRMCIGHIYFRFSGLQRVDAFKLLGECKSLRTLKIGVEQVTMSGSKKPKLDLMTARGISTLRKIRGMEDVVVDVVEIPVPPRPDYMFPYTRSSDVPSSGPYFKPEMVQEFSRMLTEEMNWEEETPEQDQIQDVPLEEEEFMQSEPKSKSRKAVKDSKPRTLRSSKIQKSTSAPRKKIAKKAKIRLISRGWLGVETTKS